MAQPETLYTFGNYDIFLAHQPSRPDVALRQESLRHDFPEASDEDIERVAAGIGSGAFLLDKQTTLSRELIQVRDRRSDAGIVLAQLSVRTLTSGRFGGVLGSVERKAKSHVEKYTWREAGQLDISDELRDTVDPEDPAVNVLDMMTFAGFRKAEVGDKPAAVHAWKIRDQEDGGDGWWHARAPHYGLTHEHTRKDVVQFPSTDYIVDQYRYVAQQGGSTQIRDAIVPNPAR